MVNVSIEVEDVNDNSPEFINEPYAATIIEVRDILTTTKSLLKQWGLLLVKL